MLWVAGGDEKQWRFHRDLGNGGFNSEAQHRASSGLGKDSRPLFRNVWVLRAKKKQPSEEGRMFAE